MVERPLRMREVPGSIRGFSKFYFIFLLPVVTFLLSFLFFLLFFLLHYTTETNFRVVHTLSAAAEDSENNVNEFGMSDIVDSGGMMQRHIRDLNCVAGGKFLKFLSKAGAKQ